MAEDSENEIEHEHENENMEDIGIIHRRPINPRNTNI